MEIKGDKQRDRKSMIITGTIQVVLLLVLYLLVAWREPNPPIPEYGVELSFGVATGGNQAPPRDQPSTPSTPVETESEEAAEEPVPSQPSSVEGEEVSEDPVQGDLPVEETGQPEASEAEIEEPASEPTEVPEESPAEAEAETAPAPAVQEPVQPVVEQAAPASENSDAESVGAGNDTGDEIQGEPKAEIDQRALYGNVTGQEGASLQMSGWIWDFEPTPQDDSEESGKIVYSVTIDDEGYIIKIVPKTSTVSPSVEKYYRQAVERLTFSKTSSYKPAPTSTGTITFIIKTK